MILLILLIVFILILFLIKRFLDKYGIIFPSSLLTMFIKQVKEIEESGNGRVIIRSIGDYTAIILTKDGKIIDTISVDIGGNKIYSGVVKDNQPNFGNILVPIKFPIGINSTKVDEIRELEDKLVDEIMEIIVRHKIN